MNLQQLHNELTQLINLLEEVNVNPEKIPVKIAQQPNYPLVSPHFDLGAKIGETGNLEAIYLLASNATEYLPTSYNQAAENFSDLGSF